MAQPRRCPLYFGYGSNMWIDQMNRRCPDSHLVGIARLENWRWFISERRYANIIPSCTSGEEVWGLVYLISKEDEKKLDRAEGPNYSKQYHMVQFHPPHYRLSDEVIEMETLIYVDTQNTTDGEPYEEYIDRINHGIRDALRNRVPEAYFEDHLRPFIPSPQ